VKEYFGNVGARDRKVWAIYKEGGDPSLPNTQDAMAAIMDSGASASEALVEIKKFVNAWRIHFRIGSQYAS
jgi:hypothetical protein